MTVYHSLAEIAEERDLYRQMKDPVRWLTKQITTGRVKARKIGRSWCMTDAEIEAAFQAVANTEPVRHEEPTRIGLSAASMRRRMAS